MALFVQGPIMKKALSTILLSGIISTVLASPKVLTEPQFINLMATRYHFNKQQLSTLLHKEKPNKSILHKITYPYESKPWQTYKKHFVTNQRIKAGEVYWNKYSKTLQRAHKVYGVPASVIVAIIGIESNYGRHTHQYNELDALTTLSFHYPKRAAFFQKELKQYLLLTREQKMDPARLRGSYAGALGIPQFMPSSYRHYGVDFSGSGQVNLLTNDIDAIGSIANYLDKNGWNRWGPIATPVTVTGSAYKHALSTNGKPNYSVRQLRKLGVIVPTQIHAWRKAALVKMGNTHPHYYLTYKNFRSIMSYNPRIPYAMVAYKISIALKKHHV